MHRTVSLLFACVVVAPVGMVSAQQAKTPFARAVSAYKSAETIDAQFEQRLTNGLIGTTATTHGELFRQRPNLFAIVFAKPMTDKIVSDGKALWVYLPSSVQGQVIKSPIAKGDAETPLDPLGEILNASADRYSISDAGATTVNGYATHIVGLVPKRENTTSAFTKATLWIDDRDGSIRQFETEEPSGVTRHIVITKVVVNSSLPRSTFTFVPPAGVRVVER